MMRSCCLIHKTIIILRHNFYSVYLGPCLSLSQFMSYFCDLFFIFSLIFIVINHIASLKQTHLLFVLFLGCLLIFLDYKVDEESEYLSNNLTPQELTLVKNLISVAVALSIAIVIMFLYFNETY